MVLHEPLEVAGRRRAHEGHDVQAPAPRVRRRAVDRREDGHGVGRVGRDGDDEVAAPIDLPGAGDVAAPRPLVGDAVVHGLLGALVGAAVRPLGRAQLFQFLDLLALLRGGHGAGRRREEQRGGEARHARARRHACARRATSAAAATLFGERDRCDDAYLVSATAAPRVGRPVRGVAVARFVTAFGASSAAFAPRAPRAASPQNFTHNHASVL